MSGAWRPSRIRKALAAGVLVCAGLALSQPAARGQMQVVSGSGPSTWVIPAPCPAPGHPPVMIPPSVTPTPTTPTTPTPTTPTPTPTTPEAAPSPAPSLGSEVASAVGGNYFTGSAYIDTAIPVSQFRFRFDSAYNNNRPDRAEYFYAKCGCFRPGDPNAAGPPLPETSVDYQELRPYLELALGERFSIFGEMPIRLINPEVNQNAGGVGDINFGFKYAAVYTPCTVLTGQVRGYAPTGDPFRGFGVNHWSVEPSLLLYQKLSDRLFLEGQVGTWISLGSPTNFAGTILLYGLSLSYLVVNNEDFRVAPVTEVFGWNVLNGLELADGAVNDAAGTQIVNLKLGVRFGFGRTEQPGVLDRADLYVGYGRALTGAVWYEDLFRVEFRYRF